jgi:hypothetical protein
MGQRLIITEADKTRIKVLYEQEEKVRAFPLSNTNFASFDPQTKEEIINSLMSNDEIKEKLKISDVNKNFDVVSYLNGKGVTPYIFMKHIPGTGEKFGMMGVYLDLFGKDVNVKLNMNNVSGYLIKEIPWTLLSLNVKF